MNRSVRTRQVRVAAIGAVSAALLAMTGAYITATAAAAPAPTPRLVALRDSVGATTGHRTGVYASARMSVELTLAPRKPAGLAAALRSAYTQGSSGYHRWLSRGGGV